MFKLKHTVLLAAGLAALAGCTQKAPDSAAIEAMIGKHTTSWVEAYNAGDADKVSASYAEDAQGKDDWQIIRDMWNMDAAPPPPPPPVETKKPAPKKVEANHAKSKKKHH